MSAVTGNKYGYIAERSDILFDDVRCNGHEVNISQCRHNGYKVHNCRNNEMAGVLCQDGETFFMLSSCNINISGLYCL